jgi:hypothetical protein
MTRLVDRSSRKLVLLLFILIRNIHLLHSIAIVGYAGDTTLFNAILIVGYSVLARAFRHPVLPMDLPFGAGYPSINGSRLSDIVLLF